MALTLGVTSFLLLFPHVTFTLNGPGQNPSNNRAAPHLLEHLHLWNTQRFCPGRGWGSRRGEWEPPLLCKLQMLEFLWPRPNCTSHLQFWSFNWLKNIVTAPQTGKLHLDFPLCLTSDRQEMVFTFPWQMKITFGLRLLMDSSYHKKKKIYEQTQLYILGRPVMWRKKWSFLSCTSRHEGFRT